MSAPEACPCRFCGGRFQPSGIVNHETHCDASPNTGVPVEQQKELGIFEDTSQERTAAESDPDQRASDGGQVSLPPKQTLPGADNTNDDNSAAQVLDKCPQCGSRDTIPAHEAREYFVQELDEMPAGLRATLDAAEKYCNDCFSVYGGRFDEPWPLQEADE